MLQTLRLKLQTLTGEVLHEFSPSIPDLPPVILETPGDKTHGDFSTNIAMRLTKLLKKDPMSTGGQLVGLIEKKIASSPLRGKIETMEVKKPGFINFFLSQEAFCDVLSDVFSKNADYGRLEIGKNQKIQIEFVSANPTGPLSVAHARQAAVGDALANIMGFAGFNVTKEFYVNDEGNQINILGRSIELRAKEILGDKIEFPEDGYQGDYIRDMAQEFINLRKVKTCDDLKKISPGDFRQFGVDHLLNVIKTELKDFGVLFDVWSHQSQIATIAATQKVLEMLKTKGFVYEKDGAWWFESTHFGDDKDRVVKKSDGSFTYLAPDIVYHKNKFERGFKNVFNIWGPDHHGYIPRIKAAAAALGYNPNALEVLIVQLATISRDGKPLSMSTRRGQYISLREVIDEVGVDAARFFFLMRHRSVHLDFDLELAKKETPENPVYYIQYAHARIHSIFDAARAQGFHPHRGQCKLLSTPEEIELLRKIGSFADVISICVSERDPFAFISYMQDLAGAFHKFYDKQRVLGIEPELSRERLALMEATRIVLANGLKLLGVKAPQKM